MGVISGSISFRGRFGDHYRVGDHFGVGIISGAVHISKVDKSFRAETTQRLANFQDMPGPSGRGSNRLRRVVCFYCGLPGHTVPRCFRRLQPGSRFSPYSRPSRGRSVNQ